ncbi:MAG TPA: FAD-dependent oxidoreductase [Bacteroidia bacterium]|jgi:protoporphyrinogen oxidase|nr:FAD-dependent oxidoreductase [Bacteroidia bacterium]
MKVAVIGAGPAGMTAAYELAKQIPGVDVYEAGSSVGGLAKSIQLWNQTVDIGPHRFFSSDRRVNEAWLEVVGKDYEMVDRLTRIYYKKTFFHYPLKPFDALKNLGLWEATRCMTSFFAEKIVPTKQTNTFETWVKSRFGKRLYEIFFKAYTEKLWGIKCSELDADFAAQRIKKLSLWEAVKNGVMGGKGNKHKTLVDQFAYPHGGTGMVYERMAAFVTKQGGNVFLNTPVERVITENGKVKAIQTTTGEIREYDHIVSSMPMTLLVSRLPDVPTDILERNKKLKFRNTILVYLKVEAKNLFPDNWIYVHSTDMLSGRITNFRNWVPELYGKEESTIIALEYWCYDEDEIWTRPHEQLIELAKKELESTGLVPKNKITAGHVYLIPRCYPVYDNGYKDNLKPVENFLSSVQNLHVIGRYGAFKYNNQDHSILMGLLASENILKNARHNLWDINTDYDNYQEESVITKTGLERKASA